MTGLSYQNIYKLYTIKASKWFLLLMPIVILFYQSNGLSLEQAMSIPACYSLTVAFLELPLGYVSDRIGRKKTLVLGMLFLVLYHFVLACSTALVGFLFAGVLGGVSSACISGTDSALIYDSLQALGKEDDYAKWEGRSYSICTFSEAVAAILGGGLAEYYGLRFPIYCQVLISLLGLGVACTIVEPPSVKERRKETWESIQEALRQMLNNKSLIFALALSSLAGFCSLLLAWYLQPFLEVLHFSKQEIGLIWAGLNLVVTIVAFQAYRLKSYAGEKTLGLGILLSFALAYMGLGKFGRFLPMAAGLLVFMYALRAVATPILLEGIHRSVSDDYRATILSVRSLSIRLSYAFVAPLLAMLAGWTSLGMAFMVLGGMLCLLVGGLLLYRQLYLS